MALASQIVEQLLVEDLEARLPHLLAQFPEHTEDSIRDLAPYDPGNGKYMAWILKAMREFGTLSLEYGANVRQDLERFERVKRLPQYTGRKDINQYGSFDDLHTAMEAAATVASRAEQERSLRRVAVYKDYSLVQLMTEQAAKKFAQNSALCFVGDMYARRYVVEHPPLYGVFKGKVPVAAIHPHSGQYHDMGNRPLTGQLRRDVLRLIRVSNLPELQAYYQKALDAAAQQLKAARAHRAVERRRRALNNFDELGVAPLGQVGDYQAVSARRISPLAAPLVPAEEQHRNGSPVLLLLTPEGQVAAMVDPAGGRAVDGQGNQLSVEVADAAREAFLEYIPMIADAWVIDFVRHPRSYGERFEQRMEELHRRFLDDRERGYTDPRDNRYHPPITRAAAVQRWQIALPRFRTALQLGWAKNIRLPGIGFMRVLGYRE